LVVEESCLVIGLSTEGALQGACSHAKGHSIHVNELLLTLLLAIHILWNQDADWTSLATSLPDILCQCVESRMRVDDDIVNVSGPGCLILIHFKLL